jgi:integrase
MMASIRKRTWKTNGVKQTAWQLDYRDTAGKRRHKAFPTKKAAEAWAVDALHEVKQGTHTPASASITVAQGMDMWIADGEANGLEFSTIKQRKEHKTLHIEPFIGTDKLASLTAPRIYDLDTKLRDAGRSLAMRRKVLTSVKMMLKFCQGKGKVAQNVALAVKIKTDNQRDVAPIRAGVDFPDRDELRTILGSAEGPLRPRLVVFIFTGMRASEVRGLPWPNVGDNSGIIHVRQRADLRGVLGKPKSKAGNRDIPLAPMAINALREWRATCPASKDDLVFPNCSGEVETHDALLWAFERLQIANGMTRDSGQRDQEERPILVAKYGFHALRHAAASLFIAHLGWTPKRVQTVMGHSSIQMTFDLYGHLFEDREADAEAMKRLEAAIVAVVA